MKRKGKRKLKWRVVGRQKETFGLNMMVGWLQGIAQEKHDEHLLTRIRGVDLFTCEAQYHTSCRNKYCQIPEKWRSKYEDSKERQIQIATLRWADVGLRAFGSLARRRNPTLAHRNVAHWRHVGPTFGLHPYANPIPPLSNVGPTSVKTIYNLVPT